MARSSESGDRPDLGAAHPAARSEPDSVRIFVLNHHRDAVSDLVERLRQTGYEVLESRGVTETQRLLDALEPTVVILNPLVIKQGGVEFELLERIQADDRPVPVILLVDSLRSLEQARQLSVPFRDFLMKPYSVEECAHRVELALLTRAKFMRLHRRTLELEDQVSVDHKTDLLSERYFRQIVQVEFKRARRHSTPLSFLLIDVDDFKGINDTTEYAFGDQVLRHVAQSLKRNIRETDFAARFGGDEFVLLLPQTSPAEAVHTAMRIRKKISQTPVASGRYSKQVTISVGIDCFDGSSDCDWTELERRANKALHEAKRRGKNQVWLYADTDAEERAREPREKEKPKRRSKPADEPDLSLD